jgi:hypothetical protein
MVLRESSKERQGECRDGAWIVSWFRFPRRRVDVPARLGSADAGHTSMKVLCVAEKPSIAKSITRILSGGQFNTVRDSLSPQEGRVSYC